MNKRVAIYFRSSALLRKDTDAHLGELREYARVKNWETVFYADEGSCSEKSNRPSLNRLIKDARSCLFCAVLTYDMVHLGKSLKQLLAILEEWNGLGIAIYTVKDTVDLNSDTVKQAISLLRSYLKNIQGERVREGMQVSRLMKNTKMGRPALSPEHVSEIVNIRKTERLSVRDISKRTRVPRSTVFRVLKEHCQELQAVVA